jgi:uncharacterized protein (DUF1015 family)
MPLVRPFRGLGYALDRFGTATIPDRVRLPEEPDQHPGRLADLTDVASPPYDIIDDEQRERLLARSPYNAVRLELSSADEPHAQAAATLRSWVAEGILERRREPSVYYYSHATPDSPTDPTVHGVLARVALEPYGAEMRAHELTMAAPKADRLGLLRTTQTQLSPILTIYFDKSERYRHVMARSWTDEWRARDDDGLLHTLAAVEPDDRLIGYLSRQALFMADGHHRYETALAYQAEVRGRPEHRDAAPRSLGADWIMVVLVNAEIEELQIRATHRLLRNVNPAALSSLIDDPGPLFKAHPVAVNELPARLEKSGDLPDVVFGLVANRDDAWLFVGDGPAIATRMRDEPLSSAVQRLDLAVLHAAILGDRLGLQGPAGAPADAILYTKDPADAIARVHSGSAQAAMLVRPTRLEQLAAVATAGDVMPQKSTYFYPKLLAGLAFYSLAEE